MQTAVKMKPLLPAEMKWYVNTGEPFDKAGGYAIQGIGAFMIESIRDPIPMSWDFPCAN